MTKEAALAAAATLVACGLHAVSTFDRWLAAGAVTRGRGRSPSPCSRSASAGAVVGRPPRLDRAQLPGLLPRRRRPQRAVAGARHGLPARRDARSATASRTWLTSSSGWPRHHPVAPTKATGHRPTSCPPARTSSVSRPRVLAAVCLGRARARRSSAARCGAPGAAAPPAAGARRRHPPAARRAGWSLGNVLIAAGTLILSASGTLAGRLGKDQAFAVTLLDRDRRAVRRVPGRQRPTVRRTALHAVPVTPA